MNVIESLKNFFKRFRKGESEEQKLLATGQTATESRWREDLTNKSQTNEPLNFQRDDGSTLSLIPRMQLNGEQEYEVIRNEMSGNIMQIPVYMVVNENYEEGAQVLSYKILLDMNVEQLRNLQPDECRFFSNELLDKERMKKIVTEYEGYAGGMYREQNTRNT